MKKLALLLSVAILAACGGGGSNTPAYQANNPPPVSGVSSKFTVQINEPKQMGKLFFNYSASASELVRRRIVITNPLLDKSATEPFKKYYDYFKNRPEILDFTLPNADGYVIEFLEYSVKAGGFATYSTNDSGTRATARSGRATFSNYSTYSDVPNNIIKYAKVTGINVPKSSGVTLTPKAIPGSILKFPVTGFKFGTYSGIPAKNISSSFQVRAKFENLSVPSTFNANNWKLSVRYNPYLAGGKGEKFAVVATSPDVYVTADDLGNITNVWSNGEMYLRGVATYYLNSSILLDGELSTKFNRVEDNSAWYPVVQQFTGANIPNPL